MQFSKVFLSLSFVYGTAHASFVGDATVFNPGLGACARANGDSDFIVAISVAQFGNGSNCGRNIRATSQGGLSVVATVIDKCIGCGINDIDLSPVAFSHLGNGDDDRIRVTWDFI
ncbi:hypothetical protein D9619_006292 [Psilocybe cf. subviscida]|uniref:RlpA-like protein double-psi beta-barrel domain-containing protein n=1 Tax=Psilocybe cf. subviscida TaxID=2480587 RepID=A0A8H5B3R8_9AGAR|nr:hypothetical protein D9619_006292 [Psilocybe cf. subviscida]